MRIEACKEMDGGRSYFLHARTYAKTETRLPYSFLLNLKSVASKLYKEGLAQVQIQI